VKTLASLALASSLLTACGSSPEPADFGNAYWADRNWALGAALGFDALRALDRADGDGPQPARTEATFGDGYRTVVRERLDRGETRITVSGSPHPRNHHWAATNLEWTCSGDGGCTLAPGGTVEVSNLGLAEVYAEMSAFSPGHGVIELRGKDTLRADTRVDMDPDGDCLFVSIDGERQRPVCGWAGALTPPTE
jgi:hypothetical protein